MTNIISLQSPSSALTTFTEIAEKQPHNARALLGKARALELLAERQRSNAYLEQAITAYRELISLGHQVPDEIFRQAADTCIAKMRFRGKYQYKNCYLYV